MKKHSIRVNLVGACAALVAVAPLSAGAAAMKVSNALWANGQLYGTVLTPTSFSAPPTHSLDLLYDFAMSGLAGQRSVAESAPGDPTYNGGRWWVQMVVFTPAGIAALDADGDGTIDEEITSASDVLRYASMNLLAVFPTSTYFECPVLVASGR